MITSSEAMERQWQEFHRSPIPCTAEVRFEQWGWVEIINTPMLLFRLACIGWDFTTHPTCDTAHPAAAIRPQGTEL